MKKVKGFKQFLNEDLLMEDQLLENFIKNYLNKMKKSASDNWKKLLQELKESKKGKSIKDKLGFSFRKNK